jgi:hypothetical protein
MDHYIGKQLGNNRIFIKTHYKYHLHQIIVKDELNVKNIIYLFLH